VSIEPTDHAVGSKGGTFVDYTGDQSGQEQVKPFLAEGEAMKVLVRSDQRLIVVTTKRTMLFERGGNYSAIPHHALDAIEVSDGAKGAKFLKLLFGGGYSRTISAPDAQQAASLMMATGLG
jgi:hypothetical protein